jgi:hypothetical protein
MFFRYGNVRRKKRRPPKRPQNRRRLPEQPGLAVGVLSWDKAGDVPGLRVVNYQMLMDLWEARVVVLAERLWCMGWGNGVKRGRKPGVVIAGWRAARLSSYWLRETADRWPGVARRQVTFLVAPRKVTKRRRPRHTRIPEDQARRVGGKELAPPCCFDFVFCGRGSDTFAADPPATLDLRRVCKGTKSKPGQ